MNMPAPIILTAMTSTSALVRGLDALHAALASGAGGLRAKDFPAAPLPTWIGRVYGVENEQLPAELANYACRNNQLAHLALRQDGFLDAVAKARAKYGANRVAVILGTSTS